MRKGRFRLLDLTKDRQAREKERERKIRMSATNRSRCIGANNIYINVAVLNVSKSRATKRGSCDRSLRDFRRGSDIRTGISYVLADGYIDDSHISGTLITHRREADDTCQKKKKKKEGKELREMVEERSAFKLCQSCDRVGAASYLRTAYGKKLHRNHRFVV